MGTPSVRYGEALRGFKLKLIGEALRESQGVPARAAERLGLHTSNLHRMMRDLRLDPAEFAPAPSPRSASDTRPRSPRKRG